MPTDKKTWQVKRPMKPKHHLKPDPVVRPSIYPVAAFHRSAVVRSPAIPLPVHPENRHRVDEKYSLRGYNSIDARMGTDFNQQDERLG